MFGKVEKKENANYSETPKSENVGKLSSRVVIDQTRVSKSGDAESILKIVGIVALSIFLASIIFWAVGASVPVVGLELVGKIFFGLSIGALGVCLPIICCVGGVLCCASCK